MYDKLIENYVHRLTESDIKDYIRKEGFPVTDEEVKVIYNFIKKNYKDGCQHELMSDGELYGAAQSILGTEENLDMEIYLHIEKTISYNDRIEFYMKEGGKKVWQRR